jgi:glycine C-acetyltransferase
MYGKIKQHLQGKIAGIEQAGLFKRERVLHGPLQAQVSVAGGAAVLNLCANTTWASPITLP